MPGPTSHQVDPSGKGTDRPAAGDAADDIEQPLVVQDQEQHAENAVVVHALLAREPLILAVGKVRMTHGLADQFEQVRVKKPRQPDGVRRVERATQRIQRLGRLRADEGRSRQLQHDTRL